MRTLLSAGIAAMGLALASPVLGQSKVAYLDSRRIIQEAPGSQAVRDSIQSEVNALQARLQVMEDSLSAMMDEYQRQSVTMSPEARRQKQQEIVARQGELQQRASELEQQTAQRQEQLMAPVMERIQTAISAVREEGGWSIIFDAATGAMVSADTTLDLTTQVIQRLRTAGGAETAGRN